MKKLTMIFAIMLVAALTTLSTAPAYSQNGNQPVLVDDDDDVNALPPDDGDPVDTPIDGGLSLLLAAGIGLGAKKAYNKRKNKAE